MTEVIRVETAEEALRRIAALDGEGEQEGRTDGEASDSEGGRSFAHSIGHLWRDFRGMKFPRYETILFGLRRGNVGLLLAETEVGKTTLALNLSVTLAAGKTFPPFINEPRPRRIMYVDGESTRAEFQTDINTMTRDWSDDERAILDDNLLVLCDEELKGELLNLAKPNHMATVKEAAQKFQPDLTVIDTMAALYDLQDENSNTEVKRVVMQPLKLLAREAEGAVLLAHHVGKPRGEEGNASTRAYRGRGASNFGALARSAVNLVGDRNDVGRVKLSVSKAKGYRLKDVVMRLDEDARWFRVMDEKPPETKTCLQSVLAFVTRKVTKPEIVANVPCGESTVEVALREAVKRKLLQRVERGIYAPAEATQSTVP